LDEPTKNQVWELLGAGLDCPAVARFLGMNVDSVRGIEAKTGGVRPRPRLRSERVLSLEEREEISRGLSEGVSLREIATRLGRSPSTVSREVAHNGGRASYRALRADQRAWQCAERPKPAKLLACPRLRRQVERLLEERFSPRQISHWLAREHPLDMELRVSHETIYQSLYVQGRGALRTELHQALRSGRAIRKPKARSAVRRRSRIPEMVLISERPPEVEDRAVPGHWEGDLIVGSKKRSCIGTLVERKTRFVMLLKLADGTADEVRRAMTKRIRTLPTELARSVTWDQGNEMALHREFTMATGMQVYFCDPSSPWQRGSNENTNGLLRQYFPKGTDLSVHSQAELNRVARQLNGRPRETLGWMTPLEKMREVVATTP
jgi:IS30 family transposase